MHLVMGGGGGNNLNIINKCVMFVNFYTALIYVRKWQMYCLLLVLLESPKSYVI